MAGATIAATGTGWPPRCAATGTCWRPICAATATANGRPTAITSIAGYVYDLAQLIHQQELAPVTIVAHSLGGNIAIRYAGIYPENVRQAGRDRGARAHRRKTMAERVRSADRRAHAANGSASSARLSGRLPRRYASIEDACKRMQEANRHLSPEQARHLTQHGVNQNEDGTYSWKFDNYVRADPPYGMTQAEIEELWARIACPTLLVYGKESWAWVQPRGGRPASRISRTPGGVGRRRRPLGASRQARGVSRPAARLSLSRAMLFGHSIGGIASPAHAGLGAACCSCSGRG